MRLAQALTVVLDLADQSRLEDEQADTPELKRERKRQRLALRLIRRLHLLLSLDEVK
jgi:hypothetical protein